MVSVLLPARDAANTVTAALDSVLAEPCVTEVIAVDDGSLDGTAERIASAARRDGRVRLVQSHGVGIVGALNVALHRTQASFIARMDADDLSLPGRIARAAEALAADPSLGAVATRVEAPGAGEGMQRYVAWQNGVVTPEGHARALFVESPLCHPSVVLRREALVGVGAWHGTPWPEDWDLWLRLDAAGWRMAKVPEVLLRWCHTPGRLTLRDPRYALERMVDARAWYLPRRLKAVRRDRAIAVWGAGVTGKRLVRGLELQHFQCEMFIDIDPSKIGRTARGLPIRASDALDSRRHFVLVAVGARGARDLVRAFLDERTWREGDDYLCAS